MPPGPIQDLTHGSIFIRNAQFFKFFLQCNIRSTGGRINLTEAPARLWFSPDRFIRMHPSGSGRRRKEAQNRCSLESASGTFGSTLVGRNPFCQVGFCGPLRAAREIGRVMYARTVQQLPRNCRRARLAAGALVSPAVVQSHGAAEPEACVHGCRCQLPVPCCTSKPADEPVHPASLTKMMTLYMAFELIELGRLSYDSAGSRSPRRAPTPPPRKLDLDPGEELTVLDAIKALVTKSANDVAIALADAHRRHRGQLRRA